MRQPIAQYLGKARPHRRSRRLLTVYLPLDCKEKLLVCREHTGRSMCEILTMLIRSNLGGGEPQSAVTRSPGVAGEVIQSGPYAGMRRQVITQPAQPDWIDYSAQPAQGDGRVVDRGDTVVPWRL